MISDLHVFSLVRIFWLEMLITYLFWRNLFISIRKTRELLNDGWFIDCLDSGSSYSYRRENGK